MIDYCHLKKRKYHYLEGDETKIENYAEAAADPDETWVCHHRRELVPDRKTIAELKEMGLYWNRPPEELIFLRNADHAKLHSGGKNNNMYGRSSREGVPEEVAADRKRRYSESMKGKNKGKRQWTDGKTTVFRRECPGEGWVLGCDPSIKEKCRQAQLGRRHSEATKEKCRQAHLGRKWWNNGEKTVFRRECPGEGWVLGLSPSSKARRQRRKRE